MRGDIPQAALRLCATLPVRTHVQAVGKEDGRMRHCVNNVRPVAIGHTVYESLTECSRQLGVARETVRNMIQRGEARYA